jgi:molybdopterin synthase sulfur carrier subunit
MPAEIEMDLMEGSTISDLIHKLGRRFPGALQELCKDGRVAPLVNILLNGRNILHLDGVCTILRPGDLVAIFPPAGGG